MHNPYHINRRFRIRDWWAAPKPHKLSVFKHVLLPIVLYQYYNNYMDPNKNLFPSAQRQITLTQLYSMIRRRMRDLPELNRLTVGNENSDEDIQLAIDLAFSKINNTPPFIQVYTYDNPPPLNILIDYVVYLLLESVIQVHIRNNLMFNDSGITVNSDKSEKWMAFLQYLKQSVTQELLEFKKSSNIENSFGYSVSLLYDGTITLGLYVFS
jgi:hypothetical protein